MKRITGRNRTMLAAILWLVLAFFLAPALAQAWTSSQISDVEVSVAIAESGPSRITTRARVVVDAGKLHGIDIVPMAGAVLAVEESFADVSEGVRRPLELKTLKDGRTRLSLANGVELGQGEVFFNIVHQLDMVESGFLRQSHERARLDFTPMIWENGLDWMRIRVVWPKSQVAFAPLADPAVTRDYVVEHSESELVFTKFRPVRWYPMQVVVEFDSRLVAGLGLRAADESNEQPAAPVAAASASAAQAKPPLSIALLPLVAGLLGLGFAARKAFRVRRVFASLKREHRFLLLGRTSISVRLVISLAAISVAALAQAACSVAAGIPAIVAAAALWVSRRDAGPLRSRPGGVWRKMCDDDLDAFRGMARRYRRERRCLIDITSPLGFVAFALFIAAFAAAAWWLRPIWPRVAWSVLLDGIVFGVTAWFSSARAELPVDPKLEGFFVISRWRRALGRLVGPLRPGAQVQLWLREDQDGPIEVRLRVDPPPGLRGIEIAGEVLLCGTLTRTRAAVVLRLDPGSNAARRIAASPHAAEHHLTPDLAEEIVVLRNRRGKKRAGLAPLQKALSLLGGPTEEYAQ